MIITWNVWNVYMQPYKYILLWTANMAWDSNTGCDLVTYCISTHTIYSERPALTLVFIRLMWLCSTWSLLLTNGDCLVSLSRWWWAKCYQRNNLMTFTQLSNLAIELWIWILDRQHNWYAQGQSPKITIMIIIIT